MGIDVVGMVERMAESGTAPTDGCSLFGVGYDDAFGRLKRTYLDGGFARGRSAEKFVVGPFGSGKTHFLRQLSELARDTGCATAEVALNKDLDFTKRAVVYREISREIRTPGSPARGMPDFLLACLDRVRQAAGDNAGAADLLADAWVVALDKADLELVEFGRVARKALEAHLSEDRAGFAAACRWLGGEFADRALAKDLGLSPIGRSEENTHARRALLSLYQLVRRAGFRGTVVAFDEAEQGLGVERRRMDRILSMLQSNINELADLKDGSALVVYAFTPNLVEEMERFPALQQRVADPGPGAGFFDGNTRAPIVDLSKRDDPVRDLRTIGHRLVNLLYDGTDPPPTVDRRRVLAEVETLAEEVAFDDVSIGNRRTMVKRTCAMLIRVYDEGVVDTTARPETADEDEV